MMLVSYNIKCEFPNIEFLIKDIINEFCEVFEKEYDKPFDRLNPPLEIQTEFRKVDLRNKRGYQNVLLVKPIKYYDETKLINMKPYGATYWRMTEMYKIAS